MRVLWQGDDAITLLTPEQYNWVVAGATNQSTSYILSPLLDLCRCHEAGIKRGLVGRELLLIKSESISGSRMVVTLYTSAGV